MRHAGRLGVPERPFGLGRLRAHLRLHSGERMLQVSVIIFSFLLDGTFYRYHHGSSGLLLNPKGQTKLKHPQQGRVELWQASLTPSPRNPSR